MRCVTYNIQYSLGKDGRYDLPRIAEAVREADIIALQEVERFFPRSGDLDQVAAIAGLLPDRYWIYGPPVDLNASQKGNDGRIENRRRQFGNMLLSRWPILSSRLLLFPKARSYDRMNLQYGALEGLVDLPGRPLRIYSLHLGYLHADERLAQLGFLLEKIEAQRGEGPVVTGRDPERDEAWMLDQAPPATPDDVILMGDFNFTVDSREYDLLVGAADPVFGRVRQSGRFVDSWTAAGRGEDTGVTCDHPDLEGGERIDYGFLSPSLAGALKNAWIDEAAQGSDHQPYWFELDL